MTSSADVNAQLPGALPKVDAPDLDYEIASFGHGLKTLVRRLQEDGTTDVTIQSSQQEVKFRIPAGTYNLSKSFLKYMWQPETKGTTGFYQWAPADVTPIYSIRLATQEGGIVMSELIYADHYTKVAQKAETKLSTFLTHSNLDSFYPCNELATANLTGEGKSVGSVNYMETKYYRVSALETLLPLQSKMIQLNTFKNTLFDLDKTVYYPEPIEITIMFQGREHWYYEAKSATDAADVSAKAAPSNVLISLMEMYIYQETDPIIDAECKAAVLSGSVPFTLYVPTVISRKVPVSTSGAGMSVQIQLGSQFGTRLTKVYAIPSHTDEKFGTRYNSSNLNGSRVQKYQTKFNSINVQPDAIEVQNKLIDWMKMKEYFSGTPILNAEVYQRDWFILDDYSGITEETKKLLPGGHHNIVTGRKIGLGDIFELVTETSAAVQWYIYFVGQRVLRIAPLSKGGIGYV